MDAQFDAAESTYDADAFSIRAAVDTQFETVDTQQQGTQPLVAVQ